MKPVICLLMLLCLAGCDAADNKTATELTVMVFNAWGGGSNEGKPVDETVAVIRLANPDIVGLLETRAESPECDADDCPAGGPSVAADIAAELGYHLYEQVRENDLVWGNAILSRYPIVRGTGNALGAVIDVDGRQVAFLNVHFTDYPYQPYQLLGIEYGDSPFLATEAEAIDAAKAARGAALEFLRAELDALPELAAVFVVGDFNEPSHRDWTERAAKLGRHPLRVRYPTVQGLEEEGFTDAYRHVHGDEIAKPGFTWTPVSAADDPADHHDRIDYVLVRGEGVRVESARVVGEKASAADIVVTPWPSDHRAVVVAVSISRE